MTRQDEAIEDCKYPALSVRLYTFPREVLWLRYYTLVQKASANITGGPGLYSSRRR